MQRRDDVVVLLALLVVEQDAALERFGVDLFGDAVVWLLGGDAGGDVESVERVAGVSAGVGGDGGKGFFVRSDTGCAEATGAIGESAMEECDDIGFGKSLQCVDAAAGEQSGVEFEGGILGGGADEADGTALDVGQEGVLLGLVEAMNFV